VTPHTLRHYAESRIMPSIGGLLLPKAVAF